MSRGIVRGDQAVLELGQPAANRLQRVAPDRYRLVATGDIHRLHDPLDHAAAVVGVEDVEAGPEAGHLRLDAQLAGAQAVERANPVRRRRVAERRPDAPGHLTGGLVGEGDRQDASSLNASDRDPVPDRSGERLGLAGAGPCQHQDRAGLFRGLRLLRGQSRQDGVARHVRGLLRGQPAAHCLPPPACAPVCCARLWPPPTAPPAWSGTGSAPAWAAKAARAACRAASQVDRR